MARDVARCLDDSPPFEEVKWEGSQHRIWARSPTTNPLTTYSLNIITIINWVVQTRSLTEGRRREEEQKEGRQSELTGTAAILFYWGLPSHVLPRVCKSPLSCLLLRLEPRCKRRDLTAALCQSTALPAGTQKAVRHPKFITNLPTQLPYNPLWTSD